MNSLLALTAFVLYLIAAVQVAPLQTRRFVAQRRTWFNVLSGLALVCHLSLLYGLIWTNNGINLGLFNAIAVMTAVNVLLILLGGWYRPLEKLALILFPLAALSILPAAFLASNRLLPDSMSVALILHIALSMVAYAVLALALVQALFTSLQDYWLRRKKLRHLSYLPPLKGMEILYFQLTGLGLLLLSISLLSGLAFMENVQTQHLLHKMVLSSLAWLLFVLLLFKHWRLGRRVRQSLWLHLSAFLILSLGYFGSKLVLEFILQR